MSTATSPLGTPTHDLTRGGRWAAGLRRGLVGALVAIFVDPVREGRLRSEGWRPGTRTVIALTTVLYVVLVAAVLAATPLRSHGSLVSVVQLSMPREIVPLMFVSLVWCLALVQTAALHLHPVVRVVLLVFSGLSLLTMGGSIGEPFGADRVATYVGAALLVAIQVVVWRRPPSIWEFPAVLVAIAVPGMIASAVAAQGGANLGYDTVPATTVLSLSRLSALAGPQVLVAGLAVAQLAVSTGDKVTVRGGALAARVPRRWAVLLVAAVLLAGAVRLVLFLPRLGDLGDTGRPVWGEVIGALAALVVCGLLCRWLLRLAGSDGTLPSGEALVDEFGRAALPIAAALYVFILPTTLLTTMQYVLSQYSGTLPVIDRLGDLQTALAGTTALNVVRISIGVGLVVLAVVRARRGAVLVPLTLAVPGLFLVALNAKVITKVVSWPFELATLVETGSAIATGWIVVLLVTRRADPHRVVALAAAVALAWAFRFGDLLGSPVTTLIGLGGAGAILYGLVWSLLTGGATANEDSRYYPRQSRVLIFLASSAFAMTMLAYTCLVRSSAVGGADFFGSGGIGEQVLGGGLVTLGLLLLATKAVGPAPVVPTGSPAERTNLEG